MEAMKYEQVKSILLYAPWQTDAEFLADYAAVKEHTMVNIYRCYDLWLLAGQAARMGQGDFLEVGVWRGGTGALMAMQARRYHTGADVFLCDTFQGVVKAGPKDTHFRGGEHKASRDIAEKLMQKNGLNATIFAGIFPDQTGDDIEDRRFRLVHIDVDTYESAKGIFEWVWPRLEINGIIVYDDYGLMRCAGITKHINEINQNSDRLFFYNLNGHGMVLKLF
jgi:O-methyltransferase